MKESLMKFLIILLLVAAILMATIITLMETNILFKHEGTVFNKKIIIYSIVDTTDGGIIRLTRNDDSPIVYEWAMFDNAKTYKFFTINKDSMIVEKITVDLPKNTPRGKYYIAVVVDYISGKQVIYTQSFWVF